MFEKIRGTWSKAIEPLVLRLGNLDPNVLTWGSLIVALLAFWLLAGAGLDVFEREPAVNPDLVGLPNVILLPHMGSATVEGRNEMGEKVIINIKTLADGHRPPDRVIPAIL